jgi:protein-S-isoprenylcysteine O-methyltransferase Ste14
MVPPTARFMLSLSWALRVSLDRLLPASLFSFGAISRITLLNQRLQKPPLGENPHDLAIYQLDLVHQTVAFLFFGLVALLCLTRKPPQGNRAGLVPLIIALSGTFIIAVPAMQPATTDDPLALITANFLLVSGLIFTLYAVGSLGACFGIAPEARGLVTNGAYRVVRHPVYLGEFIAALGVFLPVLSPLTALIFVVFCALQLLRIRLEEGVLRASFPEYDDYRERVPALLPLPRPTR